MPVTTETIRDVEIAYGYVGHAYHWNDSQAQSFEKTEVYTSLEEIYKQFTLTVLGFTRGSEATVRNTNSGWKIGLLQYLLKDHAG
jgi:hypothetical protein